MSDQANRPFECNLANEDSNYLKWRANKHFEPFKTGKFAKASKKSMKICSLIIH